MSLCYDSEKWLMISFASVAISLTVGLLLINFGYGQGQNQTGTEEMSMFEEMERYFSLEPILKYCYEHASDSANPVQEIK